MNVRWHVVLALGLAGGLFGCAGAARVEQGWLARVPQEEMAPVNAARTSRIQSEDEVHRSRIALEDARSDSTVTRSRVGAARAALAAEETALKALQERGERGPITEATERVARARLELGALREEADYRVASVDVAEARLDWARARVLASEAELARAEYLAVKQHGDVRAEALKPDSFERTLVERQKRAAEAERDLLREQRTAANARSRWERVRLRLQAGQQQASNAG